MRRGTLNGKSEMLGRVWGAKEREARGRMCLQGRRTNFPWIYGKQLRRSHKKMA